MRKDLLQELVAGDMQTRDFDTIRNAISAGMNWGAFALDEESTVAYFEWRLFGDSVEIREKGRKAWSFLDTDDLDFVYSRGVFGQKVETTIGFLCHNEVIPNAT